MATKKSGLDSLFDLADGVLDSMGAPREEPAPRQVHQPTTPASQKHPASQKQSPPPGRIIDAQSSEVRPTDRAQDWEKTFANEHWWAMAGVPGSMGEAFHIFKEGSLRAEGCHHLFASHEIRDRQILEHGKRIVACTSCIIWSSTRA